MMRRTSRLLASEIVKLTSLRFFYFSIILLIAAIVLWSNVYPRWAGKAETVWHSYHSIQLFAYGAKIGLKIASFLILIFTSMIFSSEFDRGTIKLLLTRPVTRTEIFLSKAIASFLLALFFTVLALLTAAVYGLARGDLGAVWDDEHYIVLASADTVVRHAWTAVQLGFLPMLGAAALGFLASNLTDSSGYAVASSLILMILLDLATGLMRPGTALWFFNFYPDYAFETLKQFSEGSSTLWFHRRVESDLYWVAPSLSIFSFSTLAYGIFRFRNVVA